MHVAVLMIVFRWVAPCIFGGARVEESTNSGGWNQTNEERIRKKLYGNQGFYFSNSVLTRDMERFL